MAQLIFGLLHTEDTLTLRVAGIMIDPFHPAPPLSFRMGFMLKHILFSQDEPGLSRNLMLQIFKTCEIDPSTSNERLIEDGLIQLLYCDRPAAKNLIASAKKPIKIALKLGGGSGKPMGGKMMPGPASRRQQQGQVFTPPPEPLGRRATRRGIVYKEEPVAEAPAPLTRRGGRAVIKQEKDEDADYVPLAFSPRKTRGSKGAAAPPSPAPITLPLRANLQPNKANKPPLQGAALAAHAAKMKRIAAATKASMAAKAALERKKAMAQTAANAAAAQALEDLTSRAPRGRYRKSAKQLAKEAVARAKIEAQNKRKYKPRQPQQSNNIPLHWPPHLLQPHPLLPQYPHPNPFSTSESDGAYDPNVLVEVNPEMMDPLAMPDTSMLQPGPSGMINPLDVDIKTEVIDGEMPLGEDILGIGEENEGAMITDEQDMLGVDPMDGVDPTDPDIDPMSIHDDIDIDNHSTSSLDIDHNPIQADPFDEPANDDLIGGDPIGGDPIGGDPENSVQAPEESEQDNNTPNENQVSDDVQSSNKDQDQNEEQEVQNEQQQVDESQNEDQEAQNEDQEAQKQDQEAQKQDQEDQNQDQGDQNQDQGNQNQDQGDQEEDQQDQLDQDQTDQDQVDQDALDSNDPVAEESNDNVQNEAEGGDNPDPEPTEDPEETDPMADPMGDTEAEEPEPEGQSEADPMDGAEPEDPNLDNQENGSLSNGSLMLNDNDSSIQSNMDIDDPLNALMSNNDNTNEATEKTDDNDQFHEDSLMPDGDTGNNGMGTEDSIMSNGDASNPASIPQNGGGDSESDPFGGNHFDENEDELQALLGGNPLENGGETPAPTLLDEDANDLLDQLVGFKDAPPGGSGDVGGDVSGGNQAPNMWNFSSHDKWNADLKRYNIFFEGKNIYILFLYLLTKMF